MQVTTGLGSFVANLLTKTPYTIIGHGLELLPSNSWYDQLRRIILSRAEKIISISRYTDGLVKQIGTKQFLSKSRSNRFILPLGTDPEKFFPCRDKEPNPFSPYIKDGDFILLTIGRLVERKGIDLVLKAIQSIVHQNNNFKYFIGGTGPDQERLQKMVNEFGLTNHVFFLGRIEQEKLNSHYAWSDIFLLPSRHTTSPPEVEGFGIVFLEAAACQTPGIGSTSGGIPDAIEEGKTGLLTDPNDPQMLGEKILYLKNHPEIRKEMGKAGRDRVLNSYNWDKVSNRYWDLLLFNNTESNR
jgi:phosphatidylinositol alpha-1,6-mannosyltransferase